MLIALGREKIFATFFATDEKMTGFVACFTATQNKIAGVPLALSLSFYLFIPSLSCR